MKKTLSLILLFIFSLASAQSNSKEKLTSNPEISLQQIISKIEKKELAQEIRKAIISDFIILNSNNKIELENFVKKNSTFFGKKIVSSDTTEKNISEVFLNYNYSENTLVVEIRNIPNSEGIGYKRISYNYTDR